MRTDRRAQLQLTGVLLVICSISGGFLWLSGCGDARVQVTGRADLITIDGMVQFGRLERPAVAFLHDKHTQVLQKEKKDCKSCHKVNSKSLQSPKFMRLADRDRQTVMDIYHEQCIGCHSERAEVDLSTGPVTCGECHVEQVGFVSSRQAMAFDYSLHYRHIKANDQKCESCHHDYNEKTRKLYYKKNEEQPCRDCHRKQTEGNRNSMKLVSHWQCISCHQSKTGEGKQSGPTTCQGCHDPKKQQAIKKADYSKYELPRKRQKMYLLRAADEDVQWTRMKTVAFDHRAHEGYTTTCRTCHHDKMQPCRTCHTLKGDPKGQGISLEQAMHDKASLHSCIGCHETQKRAARCAGCHGMMNQQKLSTTTCEWCHRGPKATEPGIKTMTDAAIASLKPEPTLGELPFQTELKDTEIKTLVQDYQPAVFPHRTIIKTMKIYIEGSKLAKYFHGRHEVMCQGCHHNSPTGAKPPLCGSCHRKPSQATNLFMPALQQAYHLQCIGCHKRMEIDPVAYGCYRKAVGTSGKQKLTDKKLDAIWKKCIEVGRQATFCTRCHLEKEGAKRK